MKCDGSNERTHGKVYYSPGRTDYVIHVENPRYEFDHIMDDDGVVGCSEWMWLSDPDARHIVSCWNACEGMENPEEAIPALVAALEVMTGLCIIKYGNLDADVWVEIQKAREALKKAGATL